MSEEDSELGSDEEEVLVYVDFEGTNGPSTFCNEKLQLDMIGLDMEHPIMQINGKYYEGTYEDAIGTYMFFDKDPNPAVDDPIFDKIPTIKYSTKTRKLLKMKRVFVQPKLEVLGDSQEPDCIPNIKTIQDAGIPPKYQEDALERWTSMRNERLAGLNEYLEKQKQRELMRQQGVQPDSESDDDSPFIMYKPELNKPTESTDDRSESTIIDPGPSTSKDSVWSSSIDSVNSENRDNFRKVKSKEKPSESDDSKDNKKERDKLINEMDINLSSNLENMNIDRQNCTDKSVEKDATIDDTMNPVNLDKQSLDTMDVDDNDKIDQEMDVDMTMNEPLSPESPEEVTTRGRREKKIEKQRKREAKMKEISERLKKAADKIKSKTK